MRWSTPARWHSRSSWRASLSWGWRSRHRARGAQQRALVLSSRRRGPRGARARRSHRTRTDQALAPRLLARLFLARRRSVIYAMTVFEIALDASRAAGCESGWSSAKRRCSPAWLRSSAERGDVRRRAAQLFTSLLQAESFKGRSRRSRALALVPLPLLAAFFHSRAPSQSKANHQRGAFATVAIGSVASFLFASYARTLARYAVHGSLAAVAVSWSGSGSLHCAARRRG
jgi:hypothetical protein